MEQLAYVQERKKKNSGLPGIAMDSLISFRTSLSNGINQFHPPRLYTELFEKEVKNSDFVKTYTMTDGYPSVVEAIKSYEKLLATEKLVLAENFSDHVCVTAGATAAIMFYFEYFSLAHSNSKILLLGLNFYLFYECLDRYKLNGRTLLSGLKNRILPTVEEIKQSVETDNPSLIVLTLPGNPSGEIYSDKEFRDIVAIARSNNIKLLVDKCQMEEFTSEFEFVQINKILYEENYYQNATIINSISKTRSIPGARIGYIVSSEEVIDYVKYLNELYYFNPPNIYITPFIIDLFYRVVYLKRKELVSHEVSEISKIFRKFLLINSGNDVFVKFLKKFIKTKDIHGDVDTFAKEIADNYSVINENYLYTKERLQKHLSEITELQGGFNFCIKIKNSVSREQLEFCSEISKAIKVTVIPESMYFGNKVVDSDEPFWIRITAAFPAEDFRILIDNLYFYLESLKEESI
ncbi:aspartate/methionine/tyrosine aminotransferase [Paenibacillus sp. JGP012]|uniref:pyridoxal phosphate-dependent aminotransferase n=1 Tax=Paenibacillus sp. JGP012 TaxID=2735914 RepID=UPI0016188924|nr:pyridoxal phosphate-dependent aminotransferase [Paenibacillus sp. JGP012]MBB6022774.1 aspartate/methionine/tyrosine aminotransferase [Paenibacillus sp. JGP012]